MVWEHLSPTKPHVAYAVLACFAAFYSLFSSIIKEKLFLGQSVFASLYGLIVGPHVLKWFDPGSWMSNNFKLTFEISRVLLCLDIFSSVVELPKQYAKNHFRSIMTLMVPTMVIGWLLIGLFVWLIIPHMTFTYGLLISATIAATDPVLAQAVVGKGKFGRKIPSHVRHLLSAESGCNDGVAIPFVSLSLSLILEQGHHGAIAEEFLCVAFLYECMFGLVLGTAIGFVGRKAAQFSKRHDFIDKESLISFYFLMSIMCAGFGSILGTSDLLASFAAGTAFGWDGWAEDQEKGSDASVVLDLLLNISYFVYLGAIMPWREFVDSSLGLSIWRLICLAITVIVFRRIPGVLLIQGICPDIKNWREALFIGHFGPIGVGAVFAAILAFSNIEEHLDLTGIESPLAQFPAEDSPEEVKLYYLLRVIWPIVCFLIVTSMIVHGSSPAAMMLAKYYNKFTFGMQADEGDEGSDSVSSKPEDLKMQKLLEDYNIQDSDLEPVVDEDGTVRYPDRGYDNGTSLIIEDQYGEILREVPKTKDMESSPSWVHRMSSLGMKSTSRSKSASQSKATSRCQTIPEVVSEKDITPIVTSPRAHSLPEVPEATLEPLDPNDPLTDNTLHVKKTGDDGLRITTGSGQILGTYRESVGKNTAFLRAVKLMEKQKEMSKLEKKAAQLREEISTLSNSIIASNEESKHNSGTKSKEAISQ